MSGASIAAKINKAMTKVGAKVGFLCVQYRPDLYDDPIAERNAIASLSVAWSVDESFSKNPVDELSHYLIYVSNDLIKLGDILISEFATLIITGIEPIRTPTGILANDRIDIYRPTSTPELDIKNTLIKNSSNVPCAVKIGKAASFSVPNTSLKSGMTNLEVWTWMPIHEVAINDVLIFKENRYLITSVNGSDKGIKIHANSMVAGK
jgi:hypothetical protein